MMDQIKRDGKLCTSLIDSWYINKMGMDCIVTQATFDENSIEEYSEFRKNYLLQKADKYSWCKLNIKKQASKPVKQTTTISDVTVTMM
jgi:hypothetical protein